MSNAIEIYKLTLTYNDGTVFTERVPKTEKTDVVGRFQAEPSLAAIGFVGGPEFYRDQFKMNIKNG